MRKKNAGRAPKTSAAALMTMAAVTASCAGGVQHIYPQEEATSDRFDPRPDSNERQPGLFSRGALEWVRELPGGSKEADEEESESADSLDTREETGPPTSLPSIDQDPGPGGA